MGKDVVVVADDPKPTRQVIRQIGEGERVMCDAYEDWQGGVVFVNRLKFIGDMGFDLDPHGLARALGPTNSRVSPVIDTVTAIFEAAQKVSGSI